MRLAGVVTVADLSAIVGVFEEELERRRPGFVLLVDHEDLTDLEPEAEGVLYYLTRRVFEARPEAVLLVNGARPVVSERMYDFLARQDQEGRVRRFASHEQAAAFLGKAPRVTA